jgi:hypothetical protein
MLPETTTRAVRQDPPLDLRESVAKPETFWYPRARVNLNEYYRAQWEPNRHFETPHPATLVGKTPSATTNAHSLVIATP